MSGIDNGTAKTTSLYDGAIAIGSDGFASDGAWHITADSGEEVQITWDRARKTPTLRLYDYGITGDVGVATFTVDPAGSPDIKTEGTDYQVEVLSDGVLITQTIDAAANDVWEIVLQAVDFGIKKGTAKTSSLEQSAVAIGSDGFATDGAWHITGDSSDVTEVTLDRTRYRFMLMIYANDSLDYVSGGVLKINTVTKTENTDYQIDRIGNALLISQLVDVSQSDTIEFTATTALIPTGNNALLLLLMQ